MRKHATVTLGGAVIVLAASAAAQAPLRLTPAEARQHVGENAMVCGTVIAYQCNLERGSTLDLGGPAGDAAFHIAIPLIERSKFGDMFGVGFESRFDQQAVCATGRVAMSGSDYAVTLSEPAMLRTEGAPSAAARAVVFTPCDGGVTLPKVLKEVKPQYTREALDAGVGGQVKLQAIVTASGDVADARVLQSLEPSLDNQALRALREWRFAPGTRNGQPAAIAVGIEMTFTVK
jgi:TonB family protein